MSQVQKQEQTNILAIIDKLYEHRSASQHNRLVNFVLDLYAGTITQKMAKLFTFYLQRVTGPVTLSSKQFCSQSFIIVGSFSDTSLQNPETQFKIHHISKQKKVTVQSNQEAIVLDYLHYLNCQSLGESSIQQQISFMHASQFLCSIPKRRLYHILKKAIILKYSFNQTIYHEGQQIQPGQSGSGVYLVRKGDFGYFKQSQKQGKQIQTLSFSKGHLFGTLQLLNGQIKQTIPHRQFTVRCKSHSGLIYRISQQIFNTQIKPYCQNVINNRQSKLYKYLDNQVDSINKVRQQKSHLLSHTLTKGFGSTTQSINFNESSEFPLLTRTRLSVPNVETTSSFKPLLSQRIQQQGLRKTNYLSLTKQGPLKAYPMISQRSNFTESQFKQFNRLTRNKQACERIKFLQTRGNSSGSKGQILFSFFKQTWNFDKQKKMMAHNRRYA